MTDVVRDCQHVLAYLPVFTVVVVWTLSDWHSLVNPIQRGTLTLGVKQASDLYSAS